MWFVVSKKRYEKEIDEWYEEEGAWLRREHALETTVAEQTKVLKSTERETVLTDLQAALNLVRGYQRVLSLASYSDPQIIKANALLEKYGMKPEENAMYLGFQQGGAVQVPQTAQETRVELDSLVAQSSTERPKTRWEREEEFWGDEAYGKGNVRIEAEALDEGDDKEPGYTRAQVRFVDLDDDSPDS